MKIFLNIIIYLFFWNSFSQSTFEKAPDNAKEIHFVYQKKSNYFINENGVYADSILFVIDFPKMKFEITKHPLDTTRLCGFVSFKKLSKENKKFIVSKIYHINETIVGTYYIASKLTVFYVSRNDEETKSIFKKYFNEPYYKFNYRQEFNFSTRIEKRQFPTVNYELKFDNTEKTIATIDSYLGNYKEVYNNIEYKNIVLMNDNLNKFITPFVFTNNSFGVEKIETIDKIIELKSVTYK